MTRTRAYRAALILALACVTGASGCNANPEPAPLPSESVSPSPTRSADPSPSVVAPTLPAEAKGTSEASAKAFARHYFATINFAIQSGDTDELRGLSTKNCASCSAIVKNIESIYAEGGAITSKGWELQNVSTVPLHPKSQAILDLGVLQHPEKIVRTKGATPEMYNGGKQPMTMYLVRKDGGWRVFKLDKVA